MLKGSVIRIIPIFIVCTLTACGGGGGSSNPTPAPTPNVKATLTKPTYSGAIDAKLITPDKAAEMALDLTAGFDLLHVISFSDVYEHFIIHPDEDVASSQSSDINCSSGSASIKEVSKTHIEVTYKQCAQGGVITNGMMNLYVTRVYDSELMDMDIIPDLTMVDKTSGESLNINGYMQVRQSENSDFVHKATYQILLTNENNEQLYFNDFVAQVSLWGDRYGINYSGEILSTQYGKLFLETTKLYRTSPMGFDLTVNAENITLISALLGDQLSISTTAETIPLVIDLKSIPDSFLDGVNEAPQAELTATITTSERMGNVAISATNSADPDLDLLKYQWTVIDSPISSSWSIEDSASPNFSATLPGEYTIQLTVTDAQGLTSSVTTVINILKAAPEFSIAMETESVPVNTMANGKVAVSNDVFDGPFQYQIVYGPNGMTVNTEGEVQWPANIMDFGQTTEVNFAIAVSNTDKTTTLAAVLPVTSKPSLIEDNSFKDIRKFLPTSWYQQKQIFTHQSQEQLLGTIDSSAQFSSHVYLNENNLIDVTLAKSSLPDGYSYAASFDVNNDGVLDHFLANDSNGYIDGEYYWYLWLEDGSSGELTKVITIEGLSGTSINFGYFIFDDIDNDGELEMTISTTLNRGDLRQIHSYDLESFELENTIDTISGEYVGYCDIDQDGFNDAITSKEIYSLKSGAKIAEVLDNDQDIQILTTQDRCLLLSKDYIYKFENEELVSLTAEIGSSFFVGNFDNDIAQEVLYTEYQAGRSEQWFLGNVDSNGSFSKTSLSTPNNITFDSHNTSHGFHGVLAVLDLNGDGVDELLTFGTHRNTQGLSAISLQENVLVEKYSGTTFDYDYDYLSNIAQYHEDNTVTVNNATSAIRLNGVNDWIDFGQQSGWAGGKVIATEVVNNELFYYASLPYPTYDGGIAKYDSNGVMLWSNDIDPRVYNEVTLAQNHLLIKSYNSSYIIDKATSVATNANFGSLVSSPAHFLSQLFFDKDAKVFYSFIDSQLSAVVENTYFDLWGERINIPHFHDVKFIQYDDDEQVEVVFNYYESGSMKYDIVDGLTWQKEALTPGLSGYQSVHSFNDELQTCFIIDKSCRNAIISESNYIEIRDKLTNEIIYQSPQYPSNIRDLAIKHDINGHIRFGLLLNNNSVTTFY